MRRRMTHSVSVFIVALALATATLASSATAATIETDKRHYAPGELVSITGSGWQRGEPITLQVLHLDGAVDSGSRHAPWTVVAEGTSLSTSWYVDPDDSLGGSFVLSAVGTSGESATATFTGRVGLDLDQCRNGSLANLGVPCGQSPTAWVNGNLNGQNSQYREADGIPYRAAITGLVDGTWTIRLQYDFTKGGIYAIDRLTRYNLTQNSDPCLSAPSGIACTAGAPAFHFTIPGEVGAVGATAPALPNGGALDIAGTAANLQDADRRMTAWVQGGAATFVSAGQNAPIFDDGLVLQSGAATGDSAREFAFRVTLTGCPAGGANSGCSLILGWTGHVAAAKDWGPGRGASSIAGAPFHMRFVGVDQANGTSGGSQDRSVQLDALAATGTIVIVKDAQPDNAQDFSFSGTLGTFSLDDDSDPTLPNSRTFSGVAAGIHSVTESTPPAGWLLTYLVCVDPSVNSSVDLDNATATIDLEGGETVTCTFTNTNAVLLNPCLVAECDDDNVCTDDACSVVDGVAVCSNTPTPRPVTMVCSAMVLTSARG
jgi:hypothetical protein